MVHSIHWFRTTLVPSAVIMVVLSFLCSCREHPRTYKPTTTVISGQITSAPVPVLTLEGMETLKSALDVKGKFSLSGELTAAGIYTIRIGDRAFSIFVEPGDRLSLTGDYRTLPESLVFKGDRANENKYLVEYEQLKQTLEPSDYGQYFTQPEEVFLDSVENRTTRIYTHQQEYQKKNGTFDELFEVIISDEVAFEAGIIKMNYPDYYTYFAPDSVLQLSDTYESFLQNLDTDSDENLMIPSYKAFISRYVDFRTQNDTTSTEPTMTGKKLKFIARTFHAKQTSSYLYHQVMEESLGSSLNDAAVCMEEYQKLQTDAKKLEETNNRFASLSHLLKGKPAPIIRGRNIKDGHINLADLKGQVIYVDIWATWCGPCLHELPSLEKLQRKFVSNPKITFVSISIDEDRKAWQKMVQDKGMKGIQIIADNAWQSDFIANYKVPGIPRFIIIDKNGSIFNATAPRPSSPQIVKELEAALSF